MPIEPNTQDAAALTPESLGLEDLVKNLIAPASGEDAFTLLSEAIDDVAWVDFAEIRPALEPRRQFFVLPGTSSVDLTPAELATSSAIASRDYDVFYSQFKQAVYDGIWSNILSYFGSNSGSTSSEVDGVNGTIVVTTSQGSPPTYKTETYDAHAATDSMLLYLPGNTLASYADIYFTIQDASSAAAHFLRQEYFLKVRRYWFEPDWNKDHAIKGLARSIPQPQIGSPTCDMWTALERILVDAYGEGGADISALIGEYAFQPPSPPPPWHSFVTFPPGDINLGLRLVYRQEWRHLGNQRGEVVRTVPLGPKQVERVSTKLIRRSKNTRTAEDLKSLETSTERSDSTKNSSEVIAEAASSNKWNVNTDIEGGMNYGVYRLSAKTDIGVGGESRESSKDTSSRLSETMQKVASKIRNESKLVVSTESEVTFESSTASEIQNPNDEIAITYVYSKLQQQYEVLTRLAEVQSVIMVAEPLPPPAAVDFDWVKAHDWILAKVLLDDSYRDALSSISQEARSPDTALMVEDLKTTRDSTVGHLGTFATTAGVSASRIDMVVESQRGYLEAAKEQLERAKMNFELDAKRYRLYDHIRANILHYCRAIWQQEDPQQRVLRYKKMGITVPMEWYFEPDVGNPHDVDGLAQQLWDSDGDGFINGRFVAYSGGREADLSDVIVPAGPIGYYGNYALYYIRPEFAGKDIFSMLSFFKSPYMYEGEVMDPAQIQYEEDAKGAQAQGKGITNEEIDAAVDEMLSFVPELRLALAKHAKARKQQASGDNPTAIEDLLSNYQLLKKYYPEYQFRKEQARRFVVDTNSLVIDILPGDGSALEQFKRAHRGIDVLKALEERQQLAAETKRREALMGVGDYRDPDVDKVVIIDHGGSNITAGIAGASVVEGCED